MIFWDDDERRAHEDAAEAADDWVTQQSRVIHAAAGLEGPWGTLHPIGWGYVTGRITAASVPEWRQRYDADPVGVASTLAQCFPALGAQGPEQVRASAGVITAAGVVSHVPDVAASPPGPQAARNAVDELRQTHPGLVDAASKVGPPPSLFAEGDMPRATASGLDPAALRGLPWRAKVAAAWEPNRVDAFRIAQDYGTPDGDVMSRVELAGHPAVSRHINAVNAWAAATPPVEPLSPAEVAALYPDQQP